MSKGMKWARARSYRERETTRVDKMAIFSGFPKSNRKTERTKSEKLRASQRCSLAKRKHKGKGIPSMPSFSFEKRPVFND